MRFFIYIAISSLLAFGGYLAYENVPEVRKFLSEITGKGQCYTLEIRHTPEVLMTQGRNSLIKGAAYSFLEPTLTFQPCLLMEVKYTLNDEKTAEELLLWDMTSGEMIKDASQWNVTHGFQDCLNSGATKEDFNIIRILAEKGGFLKKEELFSHLQEDNEVVEKWIESCLKKKLIVARGNVLRLHFANPELPLEPKTFFGERIVTQTINAGSKAKGSYSAFQIKRLTKIAFGKDVAIRKAQEIYLPVYQIPVLNPDGSILNSYWNAVTGKKIR